MSVYSIQSIPTTPYKDQKPGTSGLRKKTPIFMEGYYTHNFVQVVLSKIELLYSQLSIHFLLKE